MREEREVHAGSEAVGDGVAVRRDREDRFSPLHNHSESESLSLSPSQCVFFYFIFLVRERKREKEKVTSIA